MCEQCWAAVSFVSYCGDLLDYASVWHRLPRLLMVLGEGGGGGGVGGK